MSREFTLWVLRAPLDEGERAGRRREFCAEGAGTPATRAGFAIWASESTRISEGHRAEGGEPPVAPFSEDGAAEDDDKGGVAGSGWT